MKKKRAFSFRIYVILLFFLCFTLEYFLEGFYDGFYYGGRSGLVVQRNALRDSIAYFFAKIIPAAISFLLINRKIGRPIQQLAQSMTGIAKGNLSERASTGVPREYQQIEDSFNQMADALQQAQRERVQQQETNQLLYANIAHDLKTPMTMVMGYAKALERDDVKDAGKQKECLKTIVKQTARANELLDVLLTYTRLENRIYKLNYKEDDLAELLRSTIAQFYGELEKHQSEVEIRIPEQPVICSFDRVEMERVFHNLIMNIVRHTPLGTKCIISLETRGEQSIVIEVLDNGPFLPDGIKSQMFLPFVKGDKSRSIGGGSGLGLSIVQKIVERHQAEIQYIEDAERGYKGFRIILPKRLKNG